MTVFISIILAFLGLCFGSFAGAQVWRLRAKQLQEDKLAGEEYDKKEYKQLTRLLGHSTKEDRSQCLSCGHQLSWRDLLPLVSWVSTRGRCRYCTYPIGWFEPLIELSIASFFVISYVFWPLPLTDPLQIIQFCVWLIGGVLLGILFSYDTKWFLLPDRIVFGTIGVSILYALLALFEATDISAALLSLGGAVVILSGLYLLLWYVSKGRWIGFGDVKLGIALAFFVGSWELAFLTLFLANLIGCLIVIPGLLTKKMTRTTQVPFGPMLIAATVVTVLFGTSLISWYVSATTAMLML